MRLGRLGIQKPNLPNFVKFLKLLKLLKLLNHALLNSEHLTNLQYRGRLDVVQSTKRRNSGVSLWQTVLLLR